MQYRFIVIIAILFSWACSSPTTSTSERPSGQELKVSWGVVENIHQGKNAFLSTFIIENQSDKDLSEDWSLYFNFIRSFHHDSTANLQIEHVNGDLWRLFPKKGLVLKAGQTIEQNFIASSWVTSITDAPMGGFFVFASTPDKPETPKKDILVLPFERAEQSKRDPKDIRPVETAQIRLKNHTKTGVNKLNKNEILPIIPTPKKLVIGNKKFTFTPETSIVYSNEFKSEAELFASQLEQVFGKQPSITAEGKGVKNAIILRKQKNNTPEAYQISITETGVIISASSAVGIFYGTQSLRSLLPASAYTSKAKTIELPTLEANDSPRFAYRGMHLDAARNFQSKKSVIKLLDLMGTYKLNKLHLHFCDDEGWRIEIPTLPELTTVGAHRAFSTDEKDALLPSFGSGPFRTGHAGSGFYTRNDFIDILKYATQRHIEVIPEIDLPGHARAAIKAMDLRYEKFMKDGNKAEAEKFLLRDLDDKSVYKSVQGWTDNTTCVASEGLYNFVREVTNEFQKMYKEAGTELRTVHSGGDEVPAGVWEKSPICQKFLSESKDYNQTRDLQSYFMSRFDAIMKEYNITTAGWEEIAIRTENGKHIPRPEFAGKGVIPYVWNNKWGWGMEDLSNSLANAGYPTVLCGVTNLYFDMAYTKDPYEPGYYWGAYGDTRTAYEFTPLDVRHCTYEDMFGNPLDGYKLFEGKETLTEEGKKNIIGIQGQLWSESTKSDAMQEYMVFPKLLALAERAWAPQAEWAREPNTETRLVGLNKDWNIFANTLGQKELPKLDYYHNGVGYRVPPAGAKFENGILEASVQFPGLEIRYSTDGSEPTSKSTLYTKPVEIKSKQVKIKVFALNGRSSKTVIL